MQRTDSEYLPPQVQVSVNVKNYPDARYDPRDIFKVRFNPRLMPKQEQTLDVMGIKAIDSKWPQDNVTPAQAHGLISDWPVWQGMFRLLLTTLEDSDTDLPCLRDGAMTEALGDTTPYVANVNCGNQIRLFWTRQYKTYVLESHVDF